MSEDITGYDGEVIGEIVDYHDDSGNYSGTAFIRAKAKGCLEMLLIFWLPAMLLTLTLALAGCNDDFFDSGGASGGGDSSGDYGTYHEVQEVLSRRGYVGFIMTQKQEPPVPKSDQEDCPIIMVLLMLLGGLCVWQMRLGRFTLCPQ